MSHKVFRLVAIIVLGIVVFKVVLHQSSAAPSNTVEVVPESAFPAGSGMNQGDVPVTRVVYVTATPQPQPTMAPTAESAVDNTETEVEPLAVIEKSPDVRIAADMQPTFRLVFNKIINELDIQPYLSVEPEVVLTTYWENGNVVLIRPSVPLEGETLYNFAIAKALTGIDGSNLAYNYGWSYKTKELVERQTHEVLEDGRESIGFIFNYPLDPATLNWTISPDVGGDLTWSQDNKTLTFTSRDILQAGTRFGIELGESLRQINGQPVPAAPVLSYLTDDLAGHKEPLAGSGNNNPFVTIQIPFRRTMEKQRVENGLTIEPAPLSPPVFDWQGDTLLGEVYLAPDTYYTISIREQDLVDPQGRQLSSIPISWSFETKDVERLVGFGKGPKLQTLQVGNGINQPTVDYSFFYNQEPMAVTFELYEMALADWQDSPVMADYKLLTERPIATWEEPAPVYEEEHYYYSNQTTIPAGIGPGFYRLELKAFGQPQDVLAILITDVALAFRMEGDNMLAWVVDLETLTPVTAADVTVYQDSSPVLSGKTDQDGFISFSVAGLPIGVEDGPLFTVKAQVGEQFTLAAINYSWNTFYVSETVEPDYLVHVTLDRPVYQPGETVSLRAVLRGMENGTPQILPAGQTLTAILRGWDENYNRIESKTITLTTGEFGVAYGEIVVPAEFGTGQYYAEVTYQEIAKSISFEVVEPIVESAPVVTVATAPIVGQGEQLQVTIEVKDSQGTPLSDKAVGVTLLESVGSGSGCFGINGNNEWITIDNLNQQGKTDVNGRYSFSITAEFGYEYHRPFADTNIEHSIRAILATVTDNGVVGNGFSIVEIANVSKKMTWQPFSMVQAAGQPFVVRAAIEDLNGSPVAGQSISVRLHHIGEYGIGNFYESGQLISRISAVSDAAGLITTNMTVQEPGYYELRLVSYDRLGNEMIAYRPLYITGSGPAQNMPSLKLGTGADGYLAGESGQLVILADEPGLAWLTLTNRDGVRNEIITLTDNVTVVNLPLTAADVPWLMVEVDMWQRSKGAPISSEYEYYGPAYSQRDGDLLSRSLSIPVIDPDKQLQVSVLETGETNEAGQTAVTVQVMNGRGEPVAAEVALSIASQALYSHFPNHQRPQYSSLFVGPAVSSRTLYHSLAPRRDLSYDYWGGGCGCGGGWWSDTRLPAVANDQPGFWFTGLQTDFNGQATVWMTLSDNPVGWHFSASAITADGQVGEIDGQLSN